MTTANVGLDDDEILDDDDIDDAGDAAAVAPRPAARSGPSPRRWLLFATLAIAVLIVDQVTKAWITTSLTPGQAPVEVLGSWLRIVYWTNSGILFGLLPQSGPAFAVASIAVVGLIANLGWPFWVGWVGVALLLAYENAIVKPNDLSRVNLAFFNVNGYISVLVFASALLGLWFPRA